MAHARSTQQKFPIVTLPFYGLQAAKLLRVSRAFQMHLNHVVTPQQVPEWQDYAEQQLGTIAGALDVLATIQTGQVGCTTASTSVVGEEFQWRNQTMYQ